MSSEIEHLYVVFAPYRVEHVGGCSHCVEQSEMHALTARRLRDHDAGSIGRYAFKAMSTWGDENDYKHFLPRILELASTSTPEPGLSLDLVVHKLDYAGWARWSVAEREAVVAVLLAKWDAAREGSVLLDVSEAVLPAVGLAALIRRWEAALDRDPAAAHRLAEVVVEAGRTGRGGSLRPWLFAQGPRLEAAFERDGSDVIAMAVDLAALCGEG